MRADQDTLARYMQQISREVGMYAVEGVKQLDQAKPLLEPLAYSKEGADAPILRAEEYALLYRAVRSLPKQKKLAVALRYFTDLSDQEIGDALGIRSFGREVTRVYHSRAIAVLRDTLIESGYYDGDGGWEGKLRLIPR